MLVILWMPWLIAAALVGLAVMAVLGLVAWFWFGRKVSKIMREVEKEMVNQRQEAERTQDAWRISSNNTQDPGFGQQSTYQAGQGPVIHIQPEEVPRRE